MGRIGYFSLFVVLQSAKLFLLGRESVEPLSKDSFDSAVQIQYVLFQKKVAIENVLL